MKTVATFILGIATGGLVLFFGMWAWLIWEFHVRTRKPPIEDVHLPDRDEEWGPTR